METIRGYRNSFAVELLRCIVSIYKPKRGVQNEGKGKDSIYLSAMTSGGQAVGCAESLPIGRRRASLRQSGILGGSQRMSEEGERGRSGIRWV